MDEHGKNSGSPFTIFWEDFLRSLQNNQAAWYILLACAIFKKLFKFLKKVIIILEAVISLFFMFKTARFLLSLGYVARYAPSKNNKTFHFCIAPK